MSAFSKPFSIPCTKCEGVVRVLPSKSLPACASKAATSVNVPPMSAATRNLGDGWDLFFMLPSYKARDIRSITK